MRKEKPCSAVSLLINSFIKNGRAPVGATGPAAPSTPVFPEQPKDGGAGAGAGLWDSQAGDKLTLRIKSSINTQDFVHVCIWERANRICLEREGPCSVRR